MYVWCAVKWHLTCNALFSRNVRYLRSNFANATHPMTFPGQSGTWTQVSRVVVHHSILYMAVALKGKREHSKWQRYSLQFKWNESCTYNGIVTNNTEYMKKIFYLLDNSPCTQTSVQFTLEKARKAKREKFQLPRKIGLNFFILASHWVIIPLQGSIKLFMRVLVSSSKSTVISTMLHSETYGIVWN